jgi:FkbM family methyltransferase
MWPIERIALWTRYRKFHRVGDIELQLLDILADPARPAVDVGANIGVYAYGLAKVTRVIAFEPISDLARFLSAARLPGLVCHNCALSDHDGQTSLHIPLHTKPGKRLNMPSANIRGDAQAPSEERVVDVRRLDGFKLTDVGFIKIDVEGLEQKVLEGGRETIAASRPIVQAELIDRLAPGCIPWADAYFRALDYQGCFVGPDRRTVFDLAAFDGSQRVENFLFVPVERAGDVRRRITERLAVG